MTLRIALAQINLTVGDIAFNQHSIIESARYARDTLRADLIVFPELTITGYPPEDLLFRNDFVDLAAQALQQISRELNNICMVIGYPEADGACLYNSTAVIHNGRRLANYRKQILPNYGVFDEHRYFSAGNELGLFELNNTRIGICICEDIWQPGLVARNKQAGADLVLILNASPFHTGKIAEREQIVCPQAQRESIPLIYVNQIGGQDELVFDGASFAVDRQGEVVFRASEFAQQTALVQFADGQLISDTPTPAIYGEVVSEYQALILGIQDYVRKNHFSGAILGLSGGIDSALVFALACDALGADNVEAVLMPSRYTQSMSVEDAVEQAEALGARHHIIPIEPAVAAFTDMLSATFAAERADTTEENIQARTRGVILMALSNKQGKLLLTTGNKSEMSVGYATLYGDMAGGFAPLKDVSKLLVYRLAEYRNTLGAVIPPRVLSRPPSAELAPDQLDEDSLPPYRVLDPILKMYIEQDRSAEAIVAAGFRREDVLRAITLVDRNEYKRRQAPPGIRISAKAFGRDRRYPISSGYRGTHSLT